MKINFMAAAQREAKKAFARGEVPVGAVLVKDGRIIARAPNLSEKNDDCTAHAEILAIRKAGRRLGDWRLQYCDLYVTLEPCPMCADAIQKARIRRVDFAASDPKGGVFQLGLGEAIMANPKPELFLAR